METITITKKEYKELKAAKARLDAPANTKKSKQSPAVLTTEERLTLLRGIKGMWENCKPDPIKELNKMRKEWDRTLPPFSKRCVYT